MGGGWTKTVIIGWWVDEKNNSAKIDWVDLDQKNNFSVADFFGRVDKSIAEQYYYYCCEYYY